MTGRHTPTRLVVIAALLAAATALAGCGRIMQSINPRPKVVTKEATVAVVGAPVTGTLEADMPADLPMWPRAEVVSSTVAAVPGGKSWTASLTTTDEVDSVFKGLVVGLQKAGWTVETTDASTPDTRSEVLTVTKGDVAGVITVTQTIDGAAIDYTMGPKQ